MFKVWLIVALTVLFFLNASESHAAGCRDKVTNCSRAFPYCHWPSLVNVLKENCPSTCNFCQKTTQNGSNNGKSNKPAKKNKPKTAKYPSYKLHYFAFRFRAEPVRMMFHYKNVKFEDFRIDQADWPSLKSNYPNGQVPALEIDGEFLMQSASIYRYVGNKLDLFGQNELEKARLDSISELHKEFFDAATPFIQAKMGLPNAGNADQLLQTQFIPAIHKYAPQLVQKLNKNSGYFSSHLSWVDFYVAESILTYNGFAPKEMAQYPELLKHNKKIYGLKQLRSYLNKRPQTPF